MERKLRLLATASVLAVALFAAGCSKKEEPAPSGANTPIAQATSETGTIGAPAPANEPTASNPEVRSESKPAGQEKTAETAKK